jgi:predicted PurR-regulated permease PerM
MVDPVQMVLLLVILVLTILLVILGIQVYYILRELRDTILKTNRILDNAESITENIDAPLSALSSLALGTKASSLLTVAKFVRSLIGRTKDDDDRRA